MTLPPEHGFQRESWDRIADGWAEWVRTNQARVHVLDPAHLALAGQVTGLRVRDAGLVIRDLVEPIPDAAVMEERDYLREYVRAPFFIIFDCLKAPLL